MKVVISTLLLSLQCCCFINPITAFLIKEQQKEEKILNRLLHDKVYSKDDPPNRGSPTNVEIGLYVNTFYQLNEKDMDFQLNIYFRQTWVDPRLRYFKEPNEKNVPEKFAVGNKHFAKMWVPDTIFRNEKTANMHYVTVHNVYVTLNITEGTVWYAVKITTKLSCIMKLHKFPLDTQYCSVVMESFGYKRNTMTLSWWTRKVEFEPDGDILPQFTFHDYTYADCSRNDSTGLGSCLEIIFEFRRNVGFFVIQVFVPSMLIVSLSWVSFWINADAAPARVSLGLLTVLTTSNYSISINENLPRVSYVKAIDVWMSTCLLFVFAALCEYAFVNTALRSKVTTRRPPVPAPVALRGQGEQRGGKIEEIALVALPIRASAPGVGLGGVQVPASPARASRGRFGSGPAQFFREWRVAEGKSRAIKIDMMARRCFPAAFVIFNIIYWLVYVFIEIPAKA